MNRFIAISFIGCVAAILTPAPSARAVDTLSKDELAFFEAKVRPVLVARCYKCHSVEERKIKGGLVLDSRDGWQKGGAHGLKTRVTGRRSLCESDHAMMSLTTFP